MLNVLASVAQFEREMMLERQREGVAKTKVVAHGWLRFWIRPKASAFCNNEQFPSSYSPARTQGTADTNLSPPARASG